MVDGTEDMKERGGINQAFTPEPMRLFDQPVQRETTPWFNFPQEVIRHWQETPELNGLRIAMAIKDPETFTHEQILLPVYLHNFFDLTEKNFGWKPYFGLDPKAVEIGVSNHDTGKGLIHTEVELKEGNVFSAPSGQINTKDTWGPTEIALTPLHAALGGYALLMWREFFPGSQLTQAQMELAAQIAFGHHELPSGFVRENGPQDERKLPTSYSRWPSRLPEQNPLSQMVAITGNGDKITAVAWPRDYRKGKDDLIYSPGRIRQILEQQITRAVFSQLFGKSSGVTPRSLIDTMMAALDLTYQQIPPYPAERIERGIAWQARTILTGWGTAYDQQFLPSLGKAVWLKYQGRLVPEFFKMRAPGQPQVLEADGQGQYTIKVPTALAQELAEARTPISRIIGVQIGNTNQEEAILTVGLKRGLV